MTLIIFKLYGYSCLSHAVKRHRAIDWFDYHSLTAGNTSKIHSGANINDVRKGIWLSCLKKIIGYLKWSSHIEATVPPIMILAPDCHDHYCWIPMQQNVYMSRYMCERYGSKMGCGWFISVTSLYICFTKHNDSLSLCKPDNDMW